MFFKAAQHAASMGDAQALSQPDTEIATVRGYKTPGTEVTPNSLKLRNQHFSYLHYFTLLLKVKPKIHIRLADE
jgi:hypothetical protein